MNSWTDETQESVGGHVSPLGRWRREEREGARIALERGLADGTISIRFQCPLCGEPHSRDEHEEICQRVRRYYELAVARQHINGNGNGRIAA